MMTNKIKEIKVKETKEMWRFIRMMTNKIKEIKVKETKEIIEIKENMWRFSDTSLLKFHPTTRALLVSK